MLKHKLKIWHIQMGLSVQKRDSNVVVTMNIRMNKIYIVSLCKMSNVQGVPKICLLEQNLQKRK